MTILELFEPGTDLTTSDCKSSDQNTLLNMSSVFEGLTSRTSIQASRYNLINDPDAFASNETILDLMKENGKNSLPVTLVDGVVRKSGAYPSLEELSEYTGLNFKIDKQPSRCCGGIGCCNHSNMNNK